MIKIITDTASEMTESMSPNLTVIPMSITFGDKNYLDGIDLTKEEFYMKLASEKSQPKTSQISPFKFEEALKKCKEKGEKAIIITMSSKLSGTYQSAVIAASEFPGLAFVVDSETVCISEKILVEYALRLVDSGMSAEKIFEQLENKKQDICLFAMLDTLEFLRRGGRISNTAGFVGGLLSVKPVLTIESGVVQILGKARGVKNGYAMLNEKILNSGGVDIAFPCAVGYSGVDSHLPDDFIKDNYLIPDKSKLPENINIIGCTIGTHAGPGTIAVAFFKTK